jgi:SAM-dependent methyltransferase
MSEVIWHDIECGSYRQDLALWLALADQYAEAGAPVLDVGAGTGRVSLALARAGHDVVALDQSRALLAELARRARGLPIETVCADARTFTLPGRQFPLIAVPMQTLQLLGGDEGQSAFLTRARRHLQAGGAIAVAIVALEDLEEFDGEQAGGLPLPDIAELDGCAYFSQPTAVRRQESSVVLERLREVVDAHGARRSSVDRTRLDLTSAEQLARLAVTAGLRLREVRRIDPTDAHVGSEVVILQ